MAVNSVQWQYWSNGWTDPSQEEPNHAHSAIGPGNGNSHYRTCITINLSSISNSEKRDKVTIRLQLYPSQSYGTSSTSEDILTAQWYTGEPLKSNYKPQGTLKQTVKTYMDFENTAFFVEFDINTSSLGKSEQTIYIYLTSQDTTTNNYHIFKFRDGNEITETITQDSSSVITGSIITSGQTYKPNDTVAIEWNAGQAGTNNPVTGYNVYLRIGGAPTAFTYNQIKIGVTSTSCNFDISGATRGEEVYVGVQALGEYYNGSLETQKIGNINQLPSAPTYIASINSLNTAPTSKITYTVTAGEDIDNNQELTLCYSLNGGEKVFFASPLDVTISTLGNNPQSVNSIVFYTFDGKEYSSASSVHTFTVTFKPIIDIVTTTHTSIAGTNNDTSTLASATKIDFTMSSGTPETVKLYVRAEDSSESLESSINTSVVSSNFYTYNKITKTINIPSIAAIPEIGNGQYYQFAFTVNDGFADSDMSGWQSIKRKPFLPKLPTYKSYDNHSDSSGGTNAKTDYYKNKVTFHFAYPLDSSAYAKISSAVITAIYGGSSKDYNFSYDDKKSVELDLSQVNIEAPATTFKIKITDVAGQTQIGDINTSSGDILRLYKTSEPLFAGNTVNITTENLKPNSNINSFKIAHPIAQATGTETIVYKYNIKVGNNNRDLAANTDFSIDENLSTVDQLVIDISANNINSIAKELAAGSNKSVIDSIVTVTAIDGFGATKSLKSTVFKVNFTEPPVFISANPQFNIKHDYYTSNSVATVNMGVAINTPLTTNPHLVNSGEGIVFVLPKASDPNNDIDFYRIYLARNDFEGGNNIKDVSQVNYSQKLIDIPYNTLLNGAKDGSSDGNFYYRYKTSRYSKNEYFYFKLQVVDKTGNTSEELICPYGFVGCRTVEPLFSAGNIRVERNSTNVTLNYDFEITDLGGSATKNGWDIDFYDSYSNFERSINGYAPKASLVIEIAPNQDFKKEETISNASNPIVFTPDGNKKLYEFTHKQTILSGFAESHAKIFMRFTLTVSYGLENESTLATISSVPQIYTYFGSVPTVAHRAHKVGINTTTFGQDDILVVENYQGAKYVKFKGTDSSNAEKTYEITFNLLDGTITGAVLNCGTW